MSTTNVEFVITASRARARVAPSTSRARVRSLVLVFVARARRDVARARRRGRATRSSRLGMTRRRRVGTSACRLFFAEMDGRRRGVALQENSIFFLARNFERGEGAVGGDDGVRPRVGGAPRARARRNGVGADDAAGYGANAASSVRA